MTQQDEPLSGATTKDHGTTRTRVTVKAMSEPRRLLGWDDKEVEFEGKSLGDLLKSISTLQEEPLYDILIEGDHLKAGFIVSVNGTIVTSPDTPLQSGDRVMTMDVVRLFHGG